MSAPARANIRSFDLYDTDRVDVGGKRDESRALREGVAVPFGPSDVSQRHRTGVAQRFREIVGEERKHVGGERPLKVERRAASRELGATGLEIGSGEDAGAQEMLTSVQTHVSVAALPIENTFDLGPHREATQHVRRRPDAVHHRWARFADVDDLGRLLSGETERSPVVWLAAARRVEEGSIERDPPGREGRDPCPERPHVRGSRVGEVRELGHDGGDSPAVKPLALEGRPRQPF